MTLSLYSTYKAWKRDLAAEAAQSSTTPTRHAAVSCGGKVKLAAQARGATAPALP